MVEPDFHPDDIANALSKLCRFNGHTSKFYSVAEHSLLVANITLHLGGNEQQLLEALLHDATEAYMSDVPAPFKQHLPDWKAMDARLDDALREWADLPSTKTGLVKEADWIALHIEAHFLLPNKGANFPSPPGMYERAMKMMEDYDVTLFCFPPEQARRAFLAAWAELAP